MLKAAGTELSAGMLPGPGPRTSGPPHGNGRACHGPAAAEAPSKPRCNVNGHPDSAAGRSGPTQALPTPTAIAVPNQRIQNPAGSRSGREIRLEFRDGKIYGPWARGDRGRSQDPHTHGHLSVKNKVVNPAVRQAPGPARFPTPRV